MSMNELVFGYATGGMLLLLLGLYFMRRERRESVERTKRQRAERAARDLERQTAGPSGQRRV
jgi:MYXO-CTERM domain-containing protein